MIAFTHLVAPLALVAAIAGGLYIASQDRAASTTIVVIPIAAPPQVHTTIVQPYYCGYYWPCVRD